MILLTKDFGHYVHFTGSFIEILNNHSLNVVFSIGEKLKKTSFTVLGITIILLYGLSNLLLLLPRKTTSWFLLTEQLSRASSIVEMRGRSFHTFRRSLPSRTRRVDKTFAFCLEKK
jgi:hypothetical protein